MRERSHRGGGAQPEECDDGNTVAGDSCSDTCRYEFGCEAITKPQSACVVHVNEALTAAVRAHDREAARCRKEAAAGQGAFAACLDGDGKGRIAKAEARTIMTVEQECDGAGQPPFAFTDAGTVNGAAEVRTREALVEAFGDPAPIAVKGADPAGAACQAELLRRHAKLLEVMVAELNRAKEPALKGSKTVEAVCSAAELAFALDGVLATTDPDSKIGKAKAGVQKGLAKRCTGLPIAGLFDCGGATTLAELVACVQALGVRTACLAFADADALDLDCDGGMAP